MKKVLKNMIVSIAFIILLGNEINANSLPESNQAILVVGTGGYNANVYLYEKDNTSTWNKKISTKGYVGKNGITDNKIEGDGKTPTGIYRFENAFGVASNPGTSLSYRKVNKYDYWVDDTNSKYYNQWVDIREVKKDWKSAEHLYAYKTAYKYGIVIDYNRKNIVPGKGSAIFLHNSTGGYTAGCISIPESDLVNILKILKPNAYIVIAKDKNSIPNQDEKKDYKNHWAKDSIQYAMDKGWVLNSNKFRPDDNITRSEFIKIINKAFNYKLMKDEYFIDVKENDWFYEDVKKGVHVGYLNQSERFRPYDNITRQEAAKIIGSIMDIKGDGIIAFKDANKIDSWAWYYVDGLNEKDIIKGNNGYFAPHDNITRAESVTILQRTIK